MNASCFAGPLAADDTLADLWFNAGTGLQTVAQLQTTIG